MISGSRNGALGAVLKTKEFQISAGTPVELGGADEGPTPHELLEASLAGCTIITVQMYANRKQWPLQSADTVVTITAEKPEGVEMSREINLVGDLTQEQKQRLLEIANKCPVHKLLSGHVTITTTLKST